MEHTITYCDGPCKEEIKRDGGVRKPHFTYTISTHHETRLKLCTDCHRKFDEWRKK